MNILTVLIILPTCLFDLFSSHVDARTDAIIKVGVYDNPPIVYRDRNGQYNGFSVEMLEHVAVNEGWHLEYVPGTFAECLKRLENGETDVQVYIAYSAEREKRFDFTTVTLISNWGQVYSQPGLKFKSILDLEGKTVALIRKTIHNKAFRHLVHRFDIRCRFLEVDTPLSVFRAVEGKKADAGVVNRIYGRTQENKFDVRKTSIIFNPIEIRYATPKGADPKIRQAIDRHLRGLKADKGSVYYQSLDRIFFNTGGTHFPNWLKWSIGFGLVLSLAVTGLILKFYVRANLEKMARKAGVLEKEIRERKRTERELQKSKEKYRAMLESMKEEVYIASSELRLEFINKAAQDRIGPRFIDKSCYKMIYGRDEKCPWCNFDRIIEGEQVETELTHPTSGRKINVSNSLIHHKAGPPSLLSIIRDITAARNMERRIRQTQKQEAIGTLAGGIAHQFNNALYGITGNISLLEMDFPDNPEVTQYTGPMKESASRMAALTEQLLAYARGGKYKIKTLCLTDFIREALPFIQHGIDSGIRFEADLPPISHNIKADPTQIHMVLSAVITNAAEAIKRRGRIRVSIEDVILDGATGDRMKIKQGKYVKLTVEDNGRGMDAEARIKIFDPFYTTKFTGRGLGMAAAYGIVENHHGRILVDSEKGTGTTVHIYLPAAGKIRPESESRDVVPVRGKGTILVIEDEKVLLSVNKELFERLGYSVLEAATGEEAIHIARTFNGEIDVALLDVVLPDINGPSVYPRLMEARPNLKVIVCSGFSIDGPAQEILDAGAQEFIIKPIDIGEISEKLKQLLESDG